MPGASRLRFRAAWPGEAHAIAGLHTDSWQRHYRGARLRFWDGRHDGAETQYYIAGLLRHATAQALRSRRR